MNESLDSEHSSKFIEANSGKIESLLKALNSINLGDKTQLTTEDIQIFLNNYLPNSDNSLYEKLISALEIENSIPLEDFLNGFTQFDEELKKSNIELNNKLLVEQNNLNNLSEQCNKYKNEKLNEEGFCQNSKLTIDIENIDLKLDLNLQNIIIEVQYNNEIIRKTFDINENNEVDKTIEFIPNKRSDNLIFTIKGINNENNELLIIGSRELPLNGLTTQDEYTVQIDIPDNNDQNNVGAVITLKILLYYSDYQFFSNKRDTTENKINKIKNAILETNKYLKDIDSIYKRNMKIDQPKYESIKWNSQIMIPSSNITNRNINTIDDTNDVNDTLKLSNKYNNTSGEVLLKVFAICVLFLGILNGIFRSELHNVLAGLLFFLSCFKHFWIDSEKYIKIFKFEFYFCLVLVIYDILWLIINLDMNNCKICDKGGSKMINLISLGLIFASVVFKSLCSIRLYAQMKIYMNEN